MDCYTVRVIVATGLWLAVVSSAGAQPPRPPELGATLSFIGAEIPLAPIVRGTPFSAEATTRTSQTLADGTHIERATSGRLFRDSEGRVRREQTILGLGGIDPSADGQIIVTIVDPVAGVRYVLDSGKRQARRISTGAAFERQQAAGVRQRESRGLPPPPPPPGDGSVLGSRAGSMASPVTEALGTRQFEGVTAIGTRSTTRIEAGRIGNDRAIEVTDERWQSPDLQMLLMSRHHDPRSGDVEYLLTNISRAEPSADLFAVPADYTIIEMTRDFQLDRFE